ncbi:MAG: C40 family peptidase [Treponema sp.]|nr:C40 family peptidase [Treponema sp.]
MTFTDLIGTPYKAHGRSMEEGFDCYGLVLECSRRSGTPLADLDYRSPSFSLAEADGMKVGLNVLGVPGPKPGRIVEMDYNGKVHIGWMVDYNNVLHATERGVRLSALAALKVRGYYEVVPE